MIRFQNDTRDDRVSTESQVKSRGVNVLLKDISTSDVSGWRPKDSSRQAEILAALRDGNLGHNIMREPQLLASNITGKHLLDLGEPWQIYITFSQTM